ncbi:hypothetical protein APHAL10511_003282 [Amanita phalloides]|nr:hypothetical protein APHAL10511_003282 [Amanita phalloides]
MCASSYLILNIFYDTGFEVGALSLLLYDYSLTLDDEVELFWKKRWTVATYLFLWICGSDFSDFYAVLYVSVVLIRLHLKLIVAVLNVSDRGSVRTSWFFINMFFGGSNGLAIEATLILRLYALYNCSRRVAYITGFAFLAQTAFVTAICAYQLPLALSSLKTKVLNGVIFCEVGNHRAMRIIWLFWSCLALFEAFILFFTIRKGYKYCCEQQGMILSRLVSTLLWDSIYYTILIEIFYFANIISNLISNRNYDLLAGPAFTVPIVVGGRMMINIRRIFADDMKRQSPSTPSQVTLEFGGMDMVDESETPPQWAYTYI